MRDLDLWRRLQQYDFAAPEVAAGLRELAGWPLAERWPFLGFLPGLLRDPDPELRCAAVAALGGARGFLAVKLLAATLYDTHPDVRTAAVEALRASAENDGARFTHALFHADAAVRRAAVAPDRPFPLPLWNLLYQLPDASC